MKVYGSSEPIVSANVDITNGEQSDSADELVRDESTSSIGGETPNTESKHHQSENLSRAVSGLKDQFNKRVFKK